MHCQGRAVWSRGGESSRLDVEQLKGEMGQGEVEPSRIYAGFAGMGLMYGPGFQSITGMRCGRGQVLAQLRLPGVVEEKWGEYVLHPSLLDGGLQACVGLMEGKVGSNEAAAIAVCAGVVAHRSGVQPGDDGLGALCAGQSGGRYGGQAGYRSV